ncbi:DNA polymerase III subunit alpha [candidate division KSB1 bacterium]|nr:DNA polymerase III subunit alpha [candidate division KSB1 bacterium]
MFVHLNVHSYYSFCRGVNSIEELCRAARDRGMDRLALTDTNGLYGLIWFLQIARETGIVPIIGAEITVENLRATLLVRTMEGYRNLCRIISLRHLEKPFSFLNTIVRYSAGLIILSDSVPLLNLMRNDIIPGDLYVELRPGARRLQLLTYAKSVKLPAVATNGVYFVDQNDHALHRVLRAIDCNTSLSRLPSDEIQPPSSWLKSADEMAVDFPDYPEALANSVRIADRCTCDLNFGGTIFPSLKVTTGESTFDYLKRESYEGAIRRYGAVTKQIQKRMDYELKIIKQKGFAPYFLVVQDIVRQSKRTCGRGSAAASLVSYCLGITHVDPIEHDLFFERFLNQGREDPPDIDVDFPWDERDEILDYVFQKYGAERTAMIANHVTFKSRAAVREIAKVYGLPNTEIKTVTDKLSSFYRANRISDIVHSHPVYKHQQFPEPWPEIFELAEKLDGHPRNLSIHCGGVVITPDPIDHYVPMEPMPKGVNIIQWEKDQTEEAGLVKIDLLGNRSLAVIRDALANIAANYNVEIDYATWNPLYDRETRRLIQTGDTIGVFYVESPAMRLLQKKSGTSDFEHLVIHSSIIRPAANHYINEYLRRLHGEPYDPLHPLLEELLKETYGIMCYQEDVSKVAIALADFDPAEADQLRKILSKKRASTKIEDFKGKFYERALKKNIPRSSIDKIWNMILSFTGYSFCKAHSASFALVSYKSCYLRAHYPAEFMAAVINNQGGYYSTFAYISEARRMGLIVELPDINESRWEYTASDRRIRVGFMQLKNIKADTIDHLISERDRNGPYQHFHDFLKRVDPDPADARILIKAGAFDWLEHDTSRPELMWRLLLWHNQSTHTKNTTLALFDEPPPPIPRMQNYDSATMLEHECETLGFLISRHPLTLYHERIIKMKYIRAHDLCRHSGEFVILIGWLVTRKMTRTKDDEMMEFVSFEDTTAIYETVFFPEVYNKFCYMLTYSKPYLIRGRVLQEFGAVTVQVEGIEFL